MGVGGGGGGWRRREEGGVLADHVRFQSHLVSQNMWEGRGEGGRHRRREGLRRFVLILIEAFAV